MLKATIYRQDGTTKEFSSELVSMSFIESRGSNAELPLAVPKLSVELEFCSNDQFFDAVAPGDKVEVAVYQQQNSNVIMLDVVSAPALLKKGEVRISCSEVAMMPVDDLYGSMVIPASDKVSWQGVKHMFGLDAVSMQNDIDTDIRVVATNKEDLVMALVWGSDHKQTIALAPFVTPSNMGSIGNGYAIFDDAYPEVEAKAPLYKILPEQIIDYAAGSGVNEVTALLTRAEGKPAPENSIEFFTATDTVLNSRTICIFEDMNMGAVLVSTSFDEERVIWSDGDSVTLPRYLEYTKAALMGITETAYLQATRSNVVELKDRQTGTTLSSVITDAYSFFSQCHRWVTRSIDFSDGRHYYVFAEGSHDPQYTGSARIGFHISPDMQLSELTMIVRSVYPGYLAGTSIVADGDSEALVLAYVGGTTMIKLVIDEQHKDMPGIVGTKLTLRTANIVQDIVAYSKTGDVYALQCQAQTMSIDRVSASGAVAIASVPGVTSCAFCIKRTMYSDDISLVPIMAILPPYSYETFNRWAVGKIQGTSVAWLFDGDPIAWAGADTLEQTQEAAVSIAHAFSEVVIHDTQSGSYKSVSSFGIAPLMTQQFGALSVLTNISKGLDNRADLGFKVGPVRGIVASEYDRPLYSVSIELSQFVSVSRGTGRSAVCSADDLDLPALNSFVMFKLSPEDQTWRLGKVSQIELMYSGQVILRLTISVVKENFSYQ